MITGKDIKDAIEREIKNSGFSHGALLLMPEIFEGLISEALKGLGI
jgi:hypothetical protein